MSLNIIALYDKYKISYKTSGSEVTRGWCNTACPFCGDDHWHLGYNQNLCGGIFSCWRCGTKSTERVLMKLLKMSFEQVKRVMEEFYIAGTTEFAARQMAAELQLPENERTLLPDHKKYLIDRNFDPEELMKKYGLVSCGNYGDYRNRILIPIYYKNRLVSFHSRDVTGRSTVPKKACEQEKEVIRHKELLYGFDEVPGNMVIVSEGPADKWRWGDEGVATFGIKFTEEQIEKLSVFSNIFVVFDSKIEDGIEHEKIARRQAEELSDRLGIFNRVWLITEIGCDPGELSQRRADRIKAGFYEMIKNY
jgi:hypothetical protein